VLLVAPLHQPLDCDRHWTRMCSSINTPCLGSVPWWPRVLAWRGCRLWRRLLSVDGDQVQLDATEVRELSVIILYPRWSSVCQTCAVCYMALGVLHVLDLVN